MELGPFRPREERHGRFVVPDLGLERIPVRCGNIRRIGRDHVHLSRQVQLPQRLEQVAYQETDAVSHVVAPRILPRDPDGRFRGISRKEPGFGQLMGKTHGDAA